MADFDLVIRPGRAVFDGGEAGRCIGVAGGRIAAVEPLPSSPPYHDHLDFSYRAHGLTPDMSRFGHAVVQ